jgi:hypothetical protein
MFLLIEMIHVDDDNLYNILLCCYASASMNGQYTSDLVYDKRPSFHSSPSSISSLQRPHVHG